MGEHSGPAPAPETRINSIPTVKVTAEQARMSIQSFLPTTKKTHTLLFQVIIYNVLFAWMISRKMMKQNVFLVLIIFMQNVYHDGFDL
jgi:hypothetical protein